MNRTSHLAGWVWLAISLALFNRIAIGSHEGRAADSGVEVVTSTRRITCLAASPNGGLWAGTGGGILWRSADGRWRKFTRADGLPSHEVRSIRVEGSSVKAAFPVGDAEWDGANWKVSRTAPVIPVVEANWRGVCYLSDRGRFGTRDARGFHEIPLPASVGTHVSALLSREDGLLAALYGDALWSYDGTRWEELDLGLPAEAREITALTECAGALWVGTRRAGLWEQAGGDWKQHLMADEPVDHNAQSMTLFQCKLLIGTLEDGLLSHDSKGWSRVSPIEISSTAPRQMASMGHKLYVRHGNGKVDAWDGAAWERDLTARLLRKEVAAISAVGDRLYAAQWGGWSEFDGRQWTSHLGLKELQGVPTTTICVQGDTVWLGTQGKGIAEISRTTGKFRWHDARNGLKDDWITAMAIVEGTPYAGTFVGGLARKVGDRWVTVLEGENVTAIESNGTGVVLAGTRRGLWRVTSESVSKVEIGETEIQALLRTDEGLWVGGRTGIYFLKNGRW